MNILVTGGKGFIGRYVVECLEQDHVVYIGTRGICNVKNSFQFFMDDVNWMDRFLTKYEIEGVIHLSGFASVSKSFSDFFRVYESNVRDTVNLLNLLQNRYKKIRLVLASSAEVYKSSDQVLTEDSEMFSSSPYGISKIYIDNLVRILARQNSLNWVVVRPFNTIGVGQQSSYVFPSFIRQIVDIKLGKKENVLKVGNIDVFRDFIDVRDVARAYKVLIENEERYDIFNVCSNRAYCLRECVEKMFEISGIDARIEVDENLLRPVDVMSMIGSNKKIFDKYNWRPSVLLEQTISEMLLKQEKQ